MKNELKEEYYVGGKIYWDRLPLQFYYGFSYFLKVHGTLFYDEILNASQEHDVNYADLGIIPVIDVYDMTYIVYSFKENKWAKSSTVDRVLFKENDSLETII